MLISRRGVLAVFLAVLSVAGCANSATSAGSSVPISASPSASASSTPAGESLSGMIVEGVEPGCLLLGGVGKPHQLIFTDPALKSQARVGATVTVVGTAKPAQMTTCQQGTPFLVDSLTVDKPAG